MRRGDWSRGESPGAVALVEVDADLTELSRTTVPDAELPDAVRTSAPEARWVWSDTEQWYPSILRAGVTVPRVVDLRLAHAILRDSACAVGESAQSLRRALRWDAARAGAKPDAVDTLFDVDRADTVPDSVDETIAEFHRQQSVLSTSDGRGGALRHLVGAESAGALIGAELHAAGLPWDPERHDAILRDAVGDPEPGGSPRRIAELAAEVRGHLGDPGVSLDSQPKLVRALHRIGLMVDSTSRWELREHDHPVIAPLIEYKRLQHLLSTNGWNWLAAWVTDRRFRPVYLPGGVVTGRWATDGGGALQIPRLLRDAVRADPGWVLVSADVAQLEPRVLAAMSRDRALADAARGTDLYAGIVDAGVLAQRSDAKVAILGAMYGATTGDSATLLPRLRRAYPRAMAYVDDAAERGRRGERVSTWWGRTCPPPSDRWRGIERRASEEGATAKDVELARRAAGDRGRFTRNFVVQGTAAEWALVWLAEVRRRLASDSFRVGTSDPRAEPSGPAFERRPHLVFFLHDEIIVHTPAEHADAIAEGIRASAVAATRMLFGDFPIDFPVEVATSASGRKN